MKKTFRSLKNIYYLFKGIKEVSDSNDLIYYKCRKCGSELTGYKGYGKLRIVCKCGHAANVYTGKDVHFKSGSPGTLRKGKSTNLTHDKYDIEKTNRSDIFRKHVNSDLLYLCDIISSKRDIAKQVKYQRCIDMIDEVDNKEGYGKILRHLQNFCGLELVSLNIVWEPLGNANTLIALTNETSILGTTYYLPMGSVLFYTVYLNPKYLKNKILVPTIAHELSHVYGYHNKMIFRSPDNDRGNKEYNEQMTDLLGIVLGMGDLMCAALDKNDIPNAGYLTNQMIHEAYNLWNAEYLSGNIKNIKTLIACSHCSQKLKVSISKERLRLVCPKCKTPFQYHR